MEISYWKSRWEKNNIGFHNPEINHYLLEFEERVISHQTKNVFVPLCGKTSDLMWFKNKGLTVTGVEAIDLACEQFFSEQSLTAQLSKSHGFTIHSVPDLALWCGNFFDAPIKLIQEADFIYDRACIVALPENLRKSYAAKINQSAKTATSFMIHTFTYNQEKMSGPPFCVPREEISELFGAEWAISVLFDSPVLSRYERYKTRGLDNLSEQVYHLVKK